jgi:hypothetical protein
MPSAFVVLPGLSERIDYLLSDFGYEAGRTLPLTPHTTFDLAYKCYADGRYSDAMIDAARERINDPMAVRFEDLVEYQAIRR